jgi:hypothetical protein
VLWVLSYKVEIYVVSDMPDVQGSKGVSCEIQHYLMTLVVSYHVYLAKCMILKTLNCHFINGKMIC